MDKLKHVPLVLLASVAVYGFFHERLFAEPLWTPDGQARFLLYSAVYWAAAGGFLFFAPRWLGPAAASFVLIYTVWWAGPVAPLAVMYFLGSCFFLGRILRRDADAATAILLGLAGWMFVIWIALHFPVNTRVVYVAALVAPYVWAGRSITVAARKWIPERSAESFGFALLLYFLLAYWLVSLKPEISADGLSMHLAMPMSVAHDGRWAFDFRHYTWALMPSGGDCVFTAAYLLGGETGARLINFALVVLIAALVYRASRRFLTAALFASTPLVLLVTGSLFVENVWAALIAGAALALVRYDETGRPAEVRTAGALFGAALAVKLIAAVFLAPAALIALWVAVRRKQPAPLFAAALLLAVLAAPPYVYAVVKSGNPVFPFANTVFRSPYFDTAQSFIDPRFREPLSWRSGYDATFRSGMFFEGQGGAAGFQYFLLLIPAAVLMRRRSARLLLAMGAGAVLILFVAAPNLRYMYPALALFSIAIGELLAEWRYSGPCFVAVAAVNTWFLAAAGWYENDFAFFRKSQIASYLQNAAPERVLIDELNRRSPGEPAVFFSTDAVAGLDAPAYEASWHTDEFWERLRNARTSSDIADIVRSLGIRHIVAPASLKAATPLFETFLREWAEPEDPPPGRMGLFRLREVPAAIPRELTSLPQGTYDDLDERIEYHGAWIHDPQFASAANGSITYSDVAGASLRLSFTGSAITYVFTKALNRGTAQVLIDGVEQARLDQYSALTQWRSQRTFDAPGSGAHVFEVRVLGIRNPRSSGTYVDLDGVVVLP